MNNCKSEMFIKLLSWLWQDMESLKQDAEKETNKYF